MLADLELKPGMLIGFGNYEQDNVISNGPEEILWRVLDVSSDEVLLISQYGLDTMTFSTGSGNVNWSTSNIRRWLNGSFLNTAFTSEEQAYIMTTLVTTPKHPDYTTSGGPDCEDKLFLLSYQEAQKYFDGNVDRMLEATRYADETKGAMVNKLGGGSWWWLRSPGASASHTAYISNGTPGTFKEGAADFAGGCIRPAMWLSLSAFNGAARVTSNAVNAAEWVDVDPDAKKAIGNINWEDLSVEMAAYLIKEGIATIETVTSVKAESNGNHSVIRYGSVIMEMEHRPNSHIVDGFTIVVPKGSALSIGEAYKMLGYVCGAYGDMSISLAVATAALDKNQFDADGLIKTQSLVAGNYRVTFDNCVTVPNEYRFTLQLSSLPDPLAGIAASKTAAVDPIVGTWTFDGMYKENVKLMPGDKGYTLAIESNGTLLENYDGDTDTATWKTTADGYSIYYKTTKETYKSVITNGKLKMSLDGYDYYFVKQ